MDNVKDTSISKQLPIDLAWNGLILGGKTGFILSVLYAVVGILVIEALGKGMGLLSSPVAPDEWGEFIGRQLMLVMLILLFYILPAMFIGAMTGMFLGYLAKRFVKMMPIQLYLAIAVGFCLVIAIGVHILVGIPIELSFQSSSSPYSSNVYETYLFSIGIPSMIYVLTGIWVGWRLHSDADSQINEEL
jgi:hypothetical protein